MGNKLKLFSHAGKTFAICVLPFIPQNGKQTTLDKGFHPPVILCVLCGHTGFFGISYSDRQSNQETTWKPKLLLSGLRSGRKILWTQSKLIFEKFS